MTAEVILSATNGANNLQGTLFKGTKFWLSAKVPQRTRFVHDIKANGGEVLLIETHADVKIVDHARKEAPPGTHSYTYIEKSIGNGALEDLRDHAVGPAPGTIRTVGSIVQPPKTTRKKYTQEDERILWDWVNTNPQKTGGTDGNEIYKQLETMHPQHPWQSWRDHWIKSMKGKARPIYPPNNAPPTPPSEVQTAEARPARTLIVQSNAAEDELDGFSDQDEEALIEQGHEILDLRKEDVKLAWARWASEWDVEHKHTADQWQAFWEKKVRPRFLGREKKRAQEAGTEQEVFPKVSVVVKTKKSKAPSPSWSRDNALSRQKSPSFHPESPKLRSTSSLVTPLSMDKLLDPQLAERDKNAGQALGNSILTRKRRISEEVPSSSPPQMKRSPLPNRSIKRPKEIASTPDASPKRGGEKTKDDGLRSLRIEFEAETDTESGDSDDGAGSPLGQQPSESLSEPDRTLRGSTQAFFREATPTIGFEVPSPGGGWIDEDADNADESASESQYDSAQERPALPDTQAILESKTQEPDLTVPEPDEWPSLRPPSSPPIIMPSSPGAESESSSAQQAQLDAEIEAMIADRLARGFAVKQVITVLNSTCTDIQLSEKVLDHMGPQEGEIRLPEDVKGVWTKRDDEGLQSPDGRVVERIERKHGPHKFNARYEWLQLMEANGEDDE